MMLVLNLKNGVNNRFLRPRYVQQEEKVIFPLGSFQGKLPLMKKLALVQLSKQVKS